MPPIGVLLGNVDFTNLFITIKGEPFKTLVEAQKAGAVTLNYGLFINTLVNFLIVAFAMFIVVKAINKMKRKKEEARAEPTTRPCPFCFSEINIKAKKCPFCTSNVE